jgi:hypothetical protein
MSAIRDPRGSAERYQAHASELSEGLELSREELVEIIETGDVDFGTELPLLLGKAQALLKVRYCLGDPLDEIAQGLVEVGDLWQWADGVVRDVVDDPRWQRSFGTPATQYWNYSFAVTTLAWAAALGATRVAEQVLSTWMLRDVTDPVVLRLAGWAGLEQPEAGPLLHPTQWTSWMAVAEAPETERATALDAYVTDWARQLARMDSLDDPTDERRYSGRVCIPAAPLAVVLDIDDTAVRSNPDYPADLVDHARSIR